MSSCAFSKKYLVVYFELERNWFYAQKKSKSKTFKSEKNVRSSRKNYKTL